ncbi:MAG TPA: KH domain-containing protein [Chloroflexota bacterium]|nr:KH domain-containing protein [Chloroflexota bacterium]
MHQLVEYLARSLVDEPDAVNVEEVDAGRVTVYEVTVAEDDVGKLIGRQGKVIRAVRSLVKAAATRQGIRVDVDVI